MLRKLIAVLLVCVLLPCVTLHVHAAGTCRAVSCYYLDGAFYAAVASDAGTPPETASLLVNNAVSGQPQNAGAYNGAPVEYLLLTDLSTSMKGNRSCVQSFAETLAEEERSRFSVTILGFGERQEIVAEHLTDAASVRSAVQSLQYRHTASDISEGLMQAVQYQTAQTFTPGAVVNLILLTDGTPYVGTNGRDDPAIARTAEAAAELIQSTPQIIVHTVCIGSDDPDQATMAAAKSGTGTFCQIKANRKEAEKAAVSVAAFVRSLSCFVFPADWEPHTEETEIQLKLDNKEFLSVPHVRNLEQPVPVMPVTEDVPFPTAEEPLSSLPDSEAGSAEDAADETETASMESGVLPAEGDAPPAAEEQETVTAPAAEPETEPAAQKENAFVLPLIIGCAVLAAAIALLLILLLTRKKSADTRKSGSGIAVKMKLLSGNCEPREAELRLQAELIIGTDAACDITVRDAAVSARNTRIFLYEQALYIQDLNAESITAINGMKIHTPNRLRSGDTVTVGSTHMQFWF